MIYYYHRAKDLKPMLKIEGWNNSFTLEINVGLWFPNTKAKLKDLLKLIRDNDENDRCMSVLATLNEDLKSKYTFDNRKVKSTKMFAKMLNSNIEQVKLFAGLYC